MIKKIRQSPKLFFLLVLIPSVIIPIAGSLLIKHSCPHGGGLAYFPIISAECFGEYLGDIGIVCFGFPGIAVLLGVAWLLKDIGGNSRLASELEPAITCVVGLIVNFAVYYLGLRLLFPKIPTEVKTSLPPEPPPERDSVTDDVS